MTDDHTGDQVLDDVAAFIGPYVAFPNEHCLTAVTLWVAHTYAPDAWYVTPRLVLDSAEPMSGKTRVLELAALLVLRPEMTISATVPAIYRMLAVEPVTLLFDEVDAIFNAKNGGDNEDLRALLNAGYKRGATVARCVGDAKKMTVERFKVFAPAALAGIAGGMPDTITTRAVTIHMRRRAPGELVTAFRERDAELEAAPVRERLAEWIGPLSDKLGGARPAMPDGVEDRPAEVWEALLAVADAAGGDWPARARAACRHFVLDAGPREASFGVRLLRDVRAVFGTRSSMPTGDVLHALVNLPESPWADMYGKPLTTTRLARELDRYGVRPVQYRDEHGAKQRGYVTAPTQNPPQTGLDDAWRRYLPQTPGTPGTGGTPQVDPVPTLKSNPVQAVQGDDGCTGCTDSEIQPGTGLTSAVPPVPGVPPTSDQTDPLPFRWRRTGRTA
jgi:hypothetical protein